MLCRCQRRSGVEAMRRLRRLRLSYKGAHAGQRRGNTASYVHMHVCIGGAPNEYYLDCYGPLNGICVLCAGAQRLSYDHHVYAYHSRRGKYSLGGAPTAAAPATRPRAVRRSVPRTSCVITREAEGAAATCCTDVGLARCSRKAVAERAESANIEGEVGTVGVGDET